jgi:Fe-S-cluster containining protein
MPWVEPETILIQKEFYKARGAKSVIQLNGRYWAVWPWKCPHLTKVGCDIYEHRPQACREYDGRDDPLMKGICKLPERKLIVLPGKGERV